MGKSSFKPPRKKLKTTTKNGILTVLVSDDPVGMISLVASRETKESFLRDMVALAILSNSELLIDDNLIPYVPRGNSGFMA